MRLLAIALLLPALHAFAQPVPPRPSCPTMSPINVFIDFTNASGSCSLGQPVCSINETVTFTASTFGYSFNCAVHTFTWDFGDGSPYATSLVAQHVYSSPGAHNVTLTIRNGFQTVTVETLVLTAVVDPPGPRVTVTAERSSGLDFTFTPAVSGPLIRLVWDFGDGTTFTTTTASPMAHHYATGGIYTVTLRAETSYGSAEQALQVAAVTRQRAARH